MASGTSGKRRAKESKCLIYEVGNNGEMCSNDDLVSVNGNARTALLSRIKCYNSGSYIRGKRIFLCVSHLEEFQSHTTTARYHCNLFKKGKHQNIDDKSLPPTKLAKMEPPFIIRIRGENGESSGTQSQQHQVTIDALHTPEPSAISQITAPEAAKRAIANVHCDAMTLLSEADQVTIETFSESEDIVVPTTKMCVIGWSMSVICIVFRLLNTKHRVGILRPKFVGDSNTYQQLIYKEMKRLGVKTLETISDAVNAADIIFVDDTPMTHLHASEMYDGKLLSFMTKGKQVVDLTTYEDVDAADKANSEFRATGASYLRLRLVGDCLNLRCGTALALADGDDELFKATESVRAVLSSECIKFGKPGHSAKYAAIIQCLKGEVAASWAEAGKFFARLPYKFDVCRLADDQTENPPQNVFSNLLKYTEMSSKFMTTREKNTVEASCEQLLHSLDVPQQAIGAVLKDMKFAQSMAKKSSSSTPVLHAAKKMFIGSCGAGLENHDLGQVGKSYKQLCKCKSPQEDEET